MIAPEIAFTDMARCGYDVSGVQKPKPDPEPQPNEPKSDESKANK